MERYGEGSVFITEVGVRRRRWPIVAIEPFLVLMVETVPVDGSKVILQVIISFPGDGTLLQELDAGFLVSI